MRALDVHGDVFRGLREEPSPENPLHEAQGFSTGDSTGPGHRNRAAESDEREDCLSASKDPGKGRHHSRNISFWRPVGELNSSFLGENQAA